MKLAHLWPNCLWTPVWYQTFNTWAFGVTSYSNHSRGPSKNNLQGLSRNWETKSLLWIIMLLCPGFQVSQMRPIPCLLQIQPMQCLFLSFFAWVSRKISLGSLLIQFEHLTPTREILEIAFLCSMSHTELRNPLWSAELSKSQKKKTLRNILKGQEPENATCKWTVLLGR